MTSVLTFTYITCIMLTGLRGFNSALHPWIKSTWLFNFLNVVLNLVCQYFREKFCIYRSQGNWSVIFFFLLCLYLVLVSR